MLITQKQVDVGSKPGSHTQNDAKFLDYLRCSDAQLSLCAPLQRDLL